MGIDDITQRSDASGRRLHGDRRLFQPSPEAQTSVAGESRADPCPARKAAQLVLGLV
jgi:hypothetical protein